MNFLAIGLAALTGALVMEPNPYADPGNSGIVFNHNEQGRIGWKFDDGPDSCISNDGSFAYVHLDGINGVSAGLATKAHMLSVSPGTYSIAVIIDGFSEADDRNGAPFDATYQNFSWHVGGTTYGTMPVTRVVPHNEQGRVIVEFGGMVFDADTLNDEAFGVWFQASIANDGSGTVLVDRVGVLATKIP